MPNDRALVMLGGGGHAAVCADTLTVAGWEVLGYYGPDDDCPEMTHLGTDDDFFSGPGTDARAAFVAIGSNRLRLRLFHRALDSGWTVPNAISPHAVIASSARVADAGVLVMPGAILNAHSQVGAAAIINTGAVVEHHVVVGQAAHIAPHVTLTGRVRVGAGTFIGAGATVIPEVTIGAAAVVGAGATVVRDVPDGVLVVGTPARIVREL